MWYFSWILGLLLACSLGIINVLRLEAQEALAKEHIPIDPLTQLLTKESILVRLREKIENSKRNGLPFSLVRHPLLSPDLSCGSLRELYHLRFSNGVSSYTTSLLSSPLFSSCCMSS